MKRIAFFLLICLASSIKAQVLELPTLKSKGVSGNVTTIEWGNYQFVENKGLILVKTDVETFDDQGRLVKVYTEDKNANRNYYTNYQFSKKGLIEKITVLDASNNLTLRTIDYSYKKGLLVSTKQEQGTNTVTKDYRYDSKDQLVGVAVSENGTLKFEETYTLDAEGRRTLVSRKLPNETAANTLQSFSYEMRQDTIEATIEKRTVNGIQYEITRLKNSKDRIYREETARVGTAQKGYQNQIYQDDERGNWVKGEVIDNQLGRSRLVLRKLTYADGASFGRSEMGPEDNYARYYRKYNQFQIVLNGKVYNGNSATDIAGTDDRLTYLMVGSASVLLKDYDKSANQTTWHRAQVVSEDPNAVFWSPNANTIDIYRKGKRVPLGIYKKNYNSVDVGGSKLVLLTVENKSESFIAKDFQNEAFKGKLQSAELFDHHIFWGKASDSTYQVLSHGTSIPLFSQVEDAKGNKLAKAKSGNFWYYIEGFRQKFDNESVGSVFPVRYLGQPSREVLDEGLLEGGDFSGFSYDKLKNRRYRLKTKGGLTVTNIASSSVKTNDNELMAYFPLTKQYLLMEGYYNDSGDGESFNHPVTVLMEDEPAGYYLYNDGAKVAFYNEGKRISKRQFSSARLISGQRKYAAVVYDSTISRSYGMTYDLDADLRMGPMKRLPLNQSNAYLFKSDTERWFIFEKGKKTANYDFSLYDGDDVVHFYKDSIKNQVEGYRFADFKSAEVGDFIYATMLKQPEIKSLTEKLGIDPMNGKVSENIKGKANTFDKEGDHLYLRDANGYYIHENLQWFNTMNAVHLVTYDSVTSTTYLLEGFYGKSEIKDAPAKILIGSNDTRVLKWGERSVAFAFEGKFEPNVKRITVGSGPENGIWRELVFNATTTKSYYAEYPVDTNVFAADIRELPETADHLYSTKTKSGTFPIVRKGELVKAKESWYLLEGDLIYIHVTDEKVKRLVRFKGAENAGINTIISAEFIPKSEEAAVLSKVASDAKEKKAANMKYPEIPRPNDEWTRQLTSCTSGDCGAGIINHLGAQLKSSGKSDAEVLEALIPYLVGISDSSIDMLFDVTMGMDAAFIGAVTHVKFPQELRQAIRAKSMSVVKDYEKKYGSPKIKTVPYKKKGNNN